MKLSNDYVIIAKDITADDEDRMLTIFKIIDNFQFSFKETDFKKAFGSDIGEKVVLPTPFSISSSWTLDEKTSEDFPIGLRLIIANGEDEVLNTVDQEAVIPKGNDKMRVGIKTQGLSVKGSGRYTLTVQALNRSGKIIAEGKTRFNVVLDIQTEE